ncbi:MAG: hypothetical protein LBU57_07775 [Dysgonamonadaceae bacterium]|nr:hypothetical protein [Dysgonamonadaceae bacterium]
MSALVKMKIKGFKDGKFKTLSKEIELQVNPSTLKYTKGVSYTKDKRIGSLGNNKKFDVYAGSNLTFDFIFDSTGVIPSKQGIIEMIDLFEEVAYNLDGDVHEPNYLYVNWGCFLYKGRMSSLSYDYSLFSPNGTPLRVKISVTITGYMDKLSQTLKMNLCSPDLSRIITLKSGESIPFWCNEIYGDPSYCRDVARYNGLSGFRYVKPGTQLMFPPLIRHENG